MSYFYLKSSQLGLLGDDISGILMCVTAYLTGRGCMKLDDWANGWIVECDDQFDLYVMLRYGQNIVRITEDEFKQLTRDRVVFFSKERTLQLRKGIPRNGAYDWTGKPKDK